MDISRLRKKHREDKERQEAPRRPEREPGEPAEKQEREPEGERAEKPAEGPPVESEPAEGESTALEDAAPPVPEAPAGGKDEAVPPVSALEEAEEAGEQVVELLVFSLSEELYAFRVTDVQEVLRPQRITRVPGTEEFISGVTSMRGKIIPVMDIKKRLRAVDGEPGGSSNIVILKGTGRGLIGALVDRTIDVLRVPPGEIMQPPSHLDDAEARFLEGVVSEDGRFVSIIQSEELLDFGATDGDS
ncbi:MAG: chemotaxis protein CheW [Nitrospirota bacterium]|jgi:purine-binding chemotaxis protein CheW